MRRSILTDPKTLASMTVRALLWYTPLRRLAFYRYWYNFTPEQLGFLVSCINQTREVPGDIFEVGCANGHTACFLNQHLQAAGIAKDYYCVDTFDGFTKQDTTYEVTVRGKHPRHLGGFRSNSVKWFKYTLKVNSCKRVHCVQADIQHYDFARPISFCMLDVKLYRPTRIALEKVWPVLSPGGMIVVGECKPGTSFDGAMQACEEFTKSQEIRPRYVLGNLGVLEKPDPRAKAASIAERFFVHAN
jgi:O-methyltransferase